METEEEKTIGQKTAEWKEAHGDVYRMEMDGHVAYLKKPTRKALGATAIVSKIDPVRYNEVLLDNYWIEGDEVIKKDDALFLGVSAQLAEIIGVKGATLKKLRWVHRYRIGAAGYSWWTSLSAPCCI